MTRPPIPAPPYSGGCLCGAVRYTVNAPPKAINACHCTDCKKLSGTTHIIVMLVPTEALTWTGEVERYRKRADSGREGDIVRCAKCGVRLWHEPLSSPELRILSAGTLDDPSWVVPTSHIWTRWAAPSDVIEADAWTCEGQPETRQLTFDAFTRVYGAS